MIQEKLPDVAPAKEKMTREQLLLFVDKFLSNLLEDTVDAIELSKKMDRELEESLAEDEMSESKVVLSEQKLKTMVKVLHNVPLITYNELESHGATFPIIQMQVLQQQVYNLCGFHMSHTLVNFVNYLKSVGSTTYLENINSSAR